LVNEQRASLRQGDRHGTWLTRWRSFASLSVKDPFYSHVKMHKMTGFTSTTRAALAGLAILTALPEAAQADTAADRLANSAAVLRQILAAPDQGLPTDVLAKAQCVVIVPGLKKAGFVVGGAYGRGFITCRRQGNGPWSAPAALRMEGGSFGFQIGATESDVILLLMDQTAVDGVLRSSFTLGAGVEAVAGPVGRGVGAATEGTMNARILSYTLSRGVFAGATAGGASLRQDLDENREMYGKELTTREVIEGKVAPPKAAAELLQLLGKYTRE
jgi:lipid-binding SYLF domain-containing protein